MYWMRILDGARQCRMQLNKWSKTSYMEYKRRKKMHDVTALYYKGLADGYKTSASSVKDLIDSYKVK